MADWRAMLDDATAFGAESEEFDREGEFLSRKATKIEMRKALSITEFRTDDHFEPCVYSLFPWRLCVFA